MDLGAVVGVTLLAALATPLGGAFALQLGQTKGRFGQSLLRTIVAVGGGLLFAAVALVLVPEGLRGLPLGPALSFFVGGAVFFLLLDKGLAQRGDRVSQVLANTLDSVPTSLGLGAAFAAGGAAAPALVVLVALQNLPEGFNGYRELNEAGLSRAGTFGVLTLTSLLGPLVAAVGYLWLGGHPAFVAGLFLVAAGGILYILVQDIAPLAHRDGHWAPALGAVFGFAVGITAKVLVA
ncbi:MAG: divalent cation transporter [Candidatus Thermoplasmatota archaeon]|jgi:ZIP family zinc transporter